ncbi:class I SAM-dependent methyltransferase [Pseudomonas sp. Pseusp122]|uniref:class I SAM-dependent methyltransferase n=1 Tax=unclassified Pseudomonas TaxID=196821 RepID=UPI0039A56745
MNRTLAALTFATLLAPTFSQAAPATAQITDEQYASVLAGPWRAPQNSVRDSYRHPEQTLKFFGLQHNQTVIEITPGGGWYSEILAPLLKDHGHYIAALQAPSSGDYYKKSADGLKQKFKTDPEHYAKAGFVEFDPKAPVFGKPGSADRVLTFRNVHNWVMADDAPQMFAAFFKVLKPGGVLGVVDHRAKDGADLESIKQSGYLPTDYVVKLATDAGFKLQDQSEINANPKDTKDYPGGVWTLPPSLKLGDQDRAKYVAIGESDRLTLRFVKPGK